jgi:hypothetical protein
MTRKGKLLKLRCILVKMHCNEQNSLPVALWFALLDAFDNTLMLPSSHPLRDACPGVQLQRDTHVRNSETRRRNETSTRMRLKTKVTVALRVQARWIKCQTKKQKRPCLWSHNWSSLAWDKYSFGGRDISLPKCRRMPESAVFTVPWASSV